MHVPWPIQLTKPTLTFEMLTSQLGNHLHQSDYHSSSRLKDGKTSRAPSAKRAIQTFDKWGKPDWNYRDLLIYINQYFNASGTVQGCPICANHKDHSIVDCPAMAARGFTVTYDASKDTNPEIYNSNPSTGALTAPKTSHPAPDINTCLAAIKASFASKEATLQACIAQLEQGVSPPPLAASDLAPVSAKKATA